MELPNPQKLLQLTSMEGEIPQMPRELPHSLKKMGQAAHVGRNTVFITVHENCILFG